MHLVFVISVSKGTWSSIPGKIVHTLPSTKNLFLCVVHERKACPHATNELRLHSPRFQYCLPNGHSRVYSQLMLPYAPSGCRAGLPGDTELGAWVPKQPGWAPRWLGWPSALFFTWVHLYDREPNQTREEEEVEAENGKTKKQQRDEKHGRIKPFEPLAQYSFILDQIEDLISGKHYKAAMKLVKVCGYLLMGVSSILLLLERSPPLYRAYTAMTFFWWTQIFSEYQFIIALWKQLHGRRVDYVLKILTTCAVSVFLLKFPVNSFTERKLYTWYFLVVGPVGSLYLLKSIPWRSGIPIFVWAACLFLSIFTLMPAEIPDYNNLVLGSGVMIFIIGIAAMWLDLHAEGNKYWLSICNHVRKKSKFPMLFLLQVLLVGLSSVMVSLSTSHITQNQKLHALHQVINWFLAGFSMVLPLFSTNSLLSRLTSIFLGFAPAFPLLSIGMKRSSSSKYLEDHVYELDDRYLQLSDVRIPLIFMVLFNVAFFGTGNFASIASFEISSVYRFITIFSPFLMSALLIFKLFIPFMLVICTFSAITKMNRLPRLGCYFLVILFSDVMTIHFFFLVRNTGSWTEIGNSISHFGIMSAQVVFVLLLFALTNIYTKDIYISSVHPSSQKA
ncbi:hypothetical protein UlMin_014920, partial [Ulmus minor]